MLPAERGALKCHPVRLSHHIQKNQDPTKTVQTRAFLVRIRFAKGKIYNKNILILEAIYVDETFRGQGVGKLLLESFENWAKEKYEDFVIEITHIYSNEKARKFYEQMGYTTSKITLRK